MLWQPSCTDHFGMWSPLSFQIEHYMDLLSVRQKLTASNVANAATPGYKTKDIDFHFEYTSRVAGEPGRANVIEAEGLARGNDGNNVSLDRESRMLAENALRFSVASQLWRAQARQIRNAIHEGRGS